MIYDALIVTPLKRIGGFLLLAFVVSVACVPYDEELCIGQISGFDPDSQHSLTISVKRTLGNLQDYENKKLIFDDLYEVETVVGAYSYNDRPVKYIPANLMYFSVPQERRSKKIFRKFVRENDGSVIFEADYIRKIVDEEYDLKNIDVNELPPLDGERRQKTKDIYVKFDSLPDCDFELVFGELIKEFSGEINIDSNFMKWAILFLRAKEAGLRVSMMSDIHPDVSFYSGHSYDGWLDSDILLEPTALYQWWTGLPWWRDYPNFHWNNIDQNGIRGATLGVPQVWDMLQTVRGCNACDPALTSCGGPITQDTCPQDFGNIPFFRDYEGPIIGIIDRGFLMHVDWNRRWTSFAFGQLPNAFYTWDDTRASHDVSRGTGHLFSPNHGTRVASVAASRLGDNRGTAGTGALGLGGLNLCYTFGSLDSGKRCLDRMWNNDARVVNMSFTSSYEGWSDFSLFWVSEIVSDFETEVRVANRNGVVIVSSAGNWEGSGAYDLHDDVFYPCQGVNLCVGGLSFLLHRIHNGSHYDVGEDIFAPYENHSINTQDDAIDIGDHDRGWRWSGTSGSAPFISGVVANMQRIYPDISTRQVVDCLRNTAQYSVGELFPWDDPTLPGIPHLLGELASHPTYPRGIVQSEEAVMCAYRLRPDYHEPPYVRKFIMVGKAGTPSNAMQYFHEFIPRTDRDDLRFRQPIAPFPTYIIDERVRRFDMFVIFGEGQDILSRPVNETGWKAPHVIVEWDDIGSSMYTLVRVNPADVISVRNEIHSSCPSTIFPCHANAEDWFEDDAVLYVVRNVSVSNGYCDPNSFTIKVNAYDTPDSTYPDYREPSPGPSGQLDGVSETVAFVPNVHTWERYESQPHEIPVRFDSLDTCYIWDIDTHCDEETEFILDLELEGEWMYREAAFHCYTDIETDPPGSWPAPDMKPVEELSRIEFTHAQVLPDGGGGPTTYTMADFVSIHGPALGFDIYMDGEKDEYSNQIDWDGYNELKIKARTDIAISFTGVIKFLYDTTASSSWHTTSDDGEVFLYVKREGCDLGLTPTEFRAVDMSGYYTLPEIPYPFFRIHGLLVEPTSGIGIPFEDIHIHAIARDSTWIYEFTYITQVSTEIGGGFEAFLPISELCDTPVSLVPWIEIDLSHRCSSSYDTSDFGIDRSWSCSGYIPWP